MSAVYLVLMRRSNKKKQPNCFDFIIIVVAGLFTSFSRRRENKPIFHRGTNTVVLEYQSVVNEVKVLRGDTKSILCLRDNWERRKTEARTSR